MQLSRIFLALPILLVFLFTPRVNILGLLRKAYNKAIDIIHLPQRAVTRNDYDIILFVVAVLPALPLILLSYDLLGDT